MVNEKPHLNFDITIATISEKLNLKERQLSEVINKYRKENFYEFINKYRIDEAKQLLKENDYKKMTILEVVYASGFNSKSVFNLSFKNQTGMTPTQYRQSFIS